MPWALILVVAGLVLVYATTYVTLGWILLGLGVIMFVIPLLIFAFAARHITKATKNGYKKFGSF